MLKEYKYGGFTYQIADEDLHLYPGAVPVEKKAKEPVATKAAEAPKNKKRSAKNKSGKEE